MIKKFLYPMIYLLFIYDLTIAQTISGPAIDPYLSQLFAKKNSPPILYKTSGDFDFIPDFDPTIYKELGIDLNSSDPQINIIIKFNGAIENLTKQGVKVYTTINDLITARIKLSQFNTLKSISGVKAISLGRPVYETLDLSKTSIKATDTFYNTYKYKGKNVIVGIIDFGFDVNNDDFKNSDGTSRILYFWDQEDNSGIDIPLNVRNEELYGREWNKGNISTCTSKDLTGHGTHVAGIASGNGRNESSGKYKGIATEADIILVKVKGSYENTLDALDWIARKAAKENKPWVTNISLGNQRGPKDGTSYYEMAITGIIQDEKNGKGKVVVIAAGNNGPANENDVYKKIHASNYYEDEHTFYINTSAAKKEERVDIELWYPSNITTCSVTVYGPDPDPNNGTDDDRVKYGPFITGKGTGWDQGLGYGLLACNKNNPEGWVGIHNEHFDGNSFQETYYGYRKDNHTQITLRDGTSSQGVFYSLKAGDWKLKVEGCSERWDAYIAYVKNFQDDKQGAYFKSIIYDNSRTMTEPSNANGIFSVGSYNTNYLYWQDAYPLDALSPFNSEGPTRDDRKAPSLYAPGAWIASTFSPASSQDPNYNSQLLLGNGKYIYKQGTSMAAPHVTGAIALLLEQNQKLKAIGDKVKEDWYFPQIKEILDAVYAKTGSRYLNLLEAIKVNEPEAGIEDYIIIAGNKVVNQGKTTNFTATFIDDDPLGDYITSVWRGELRLYSADSTILLKSNTTGPGSTAAWSCSIPSLSSYLSNVTRTNENLILGYVSYTATDNTGVVHKEKYPIGFTDAASFTTSASISGTYYTSGITVSNNSTLTIQPGTVIKLGVGANIIIEPGSKIVAAGTQANPIRFERAISNERWGMIELRGDGNQFTYCKFDGGDYNVYVRSRNNTFSNCTFKNANRGISTYQCYNGAGWSSYKLINCLSTANTYGVVSFYAYGTITGTEIKENNSYGLYLAYSRVGENNGGLGGIFNKNYIHDNRTYGVQLDIEGRLWLGYGTTKGQNKISNNGSHEIYINGNYGYLYQSSIVEGGSVGGGYSDIYDDAASNYLVYNLAKTYDGETYVSITQIAENNFWNTCGAPSTWMYGPVDITPYKEVPQSVISIPTVPLNIASTTNASPTQLITANMVSSLVGGNSSEDKSQYLLKTKQRMLDLRNEMRKSPSDPSNARRMNELFGLIGVVGKEKAAEDEQALKQLISESKSYSAANRKTLNKGQNLLEQNAMMLEVAEKMREEKYSEAIALSKTYDAAIVNDDIKRDLLTHRMAALEMTGNYNEALTTIEELKEIVQSDGTNESYTAPRYTIFEENLNKLLGIEKEIEKEALDNSGIAKTATKVEEEVTIPERFDVFQNYPNPFNPTTRIEFSLPEAGRVKMEIFDITGRLIEVLEDKNYDAGYYGITFNGKNLASGLYILRSVMTSLNGNSHHIFTKKLMLVK